MFSGIGALPEPATGSHVVNRETPVAPRRLKAQRKRATRVGSSPGFPKYHNRDSRVGKKNGKRFCLDIVLYYTFIPHRKVQTSIFKGIFVESSSNARLGTSRRGKPLRPPHPKFKPAYFVRVSYRKFKIVVNLDFLGCQHGMNSCGSSRFLEQRRECLI